MARHDPTEYLTSVDREEQNIADNRIDNNIDGRNFQGEFDEVLVGQSKSDVQGSHPNLLTEALNCRKQRVHIYEK